MGWAIYILSTFGNGAINYYALSASIELVIAYALNKRFRVVSYLGYSLVFVNFYGLMLYKGGVSPDSYDAIYAIISITQLLFLLMRAIPNGLNRLHPKHFVVRAVNFDSRGSYGRMYKNTKTKGKNR